MANIGPICFRSRMHSLSADERGFVYDEVKMAAFVQTGTRVDTAENSACSVKGKKDGVYIASCILSCILVSLEDGLEQPTCRFFGAIHVP